MAGIRLVVPQQQQGISFGQSSGNGQLQLYDQNTAWEEELKRRMALAKQQGWSDDEVNRSAMIERGVRMNQQRQQAQQEQTAQEQSQQKKKTSGRGGFLSSLISEGGAVGGAAAGAAAGTAILPGVGTVLGGILGGALGGFGGSAVEQKVRDDKVDWGKAGTEAAFSAIPGGTGKVAKVAGREIAQQGFKKGAKDELVNLFTKQSGDTIKHITDAGANLRAGVRGVTPKAAVQGRSSEKLLPSEADQINSFLNSRGVKGSNPNQLAQVEAIRKGAADEINSIVTQAPKTVAQQDLLTAQNRIRAGLIGQNGQGVGGFDPNTHGAIANRYAQQMAGITDSQGWLNFKRTLDDDINYSRTAQGVDPKIEQIASVFRKEAKGQLEKLHPEVKVPNQVYGKALDAINVLARAKDPNGLKIGSGFVDLGGNGIGSDAIQSAKDKLGGALQGVKGTRPITDQFMRQMLASGANNAFFGKNNPDPAQVQDPNALPAQPDLLFSNPQNPDESTLNDLYQSGALTDFNTAAQALDGAGSADAAALASGGLQYSSTDLFNAAMQAMMSGDTATYKSLSAAAEQASKLEKQYATDSTTGSGSSGPNVTKVTAQQYGLAQSGAQALQQLQSLLQTDPGALTRSAVPGRGLSGVGGFISNAAGTGQLDAISYNIADSILRLRTGATANADEVRKLQSQIIPRAGDSQATIQQKMQQINQIFSGVLQMANQSSGSSFEDEMAAMMGGQQYAYGGY